MMLEYEADESDTDRVYPFSVSREKSQPLVVDWRPTISAIVADIHSEVSRTEIARAFHNTLGEMIVDVSKMVRERHVVLTGGCFQNRYLTEYTVDALQRSGFKPFWHKTVPPNDGGIALGQVAAAMRTRGESD